MVTGRIEQGIIKVGDEVEIVGIKPSGKSIVTGVEMFKKLLSQGQAGDNVGLLLRGVKRDDVERGQASTLRCSLLRGCRLHLRSASGHRDM